jgi:hypothetical protein
MTQRHSQAFSINCRHMLNLIHKNRSVNHAMFINDQTRLYENTLVRYIQAVLSYLIAINLPWQNRTRLNLANHS